MRENVNVQFINVNNVNSTMYVICTNFCQGQVAQQNKLQSINQSLFMHYVFSLSLSIFSLSACPPLSRYYGCSLFVFVYSNYLCEK